MSFFGPRLVPGLLLAVWTPGPGGGDRVCSLAVQYQSTSWASVNGFRGDRLCPAGTRIPRLESVSTRLVRGQGIAAGDEQGVAVDHTVTRYGLTDQPLELRIAEGIPALPAQDVVT